MNSPDVERLQNPGKLFVVNAKGELRQLFVPFRVQCVLKVQHIPLDAQVFVEGVYRHRKYILLYFINQRLYPYWYFRIDVHH